ncbi:MAG: cyclic nucleotide-binding domain-containing protein [Elusimicrobia bacterium]|nr:cyclic nucleotide-binding domain-containing protein [Elusimicrobiota bacterium]
MESQKKIETLKSLSFSQRIPPKKLKEFSEFLHPLSFSSGEVIFEQGSRGDSLFIVGEGSVRIEKKSKGKEESVKPLALLGPGDFLGEMALIEEVPRSARAVAAHTPTLLFQLEKKNLFQWLKSQPKTTISFFVELVRILSQRLRRTTQELTLLADFSTHILKRYASSQEFLTQALKQIVSGLEGAWSGEAFLYNEFNQDWEFVSREGKLTQKLSNVPPPVPSSFNRWLSPSAYLVGLPGASGIQGYFLFESSSPLSSQEKNETTITLLTLAKLASSCLENIRHLEEETLKNRLKTAHGTAF